MSKLVELFEDYVEQHAEAEVLAVTPRLARALVAEIKRLEALLADSYTVLKERVEQLERLKANQERGKVLAEKLRMVNISFASAGNHEHVETLREIYDFLKATRPDSNLLGGVG